MLPPKSLVICYFAGSQSPSWEICATTAQSTLFYDASGDWTSRNSLSGSSGSATLYRIRSLTGSAQEALRHAVQIGKPKAAPYGLNKMMGILKALASSEYATMTGSYEGFLQDLVTFTNDVASHSSTPVYPDLERGDGRYFRCGRM
jgi:hypothetical protein